MNDSPFYIHLCVLFYEQINYSINITIHNLGTYQNTNDNKPIPLPNNNPPITSDNQCSPKYTLLINTIDNMQNNPNTDINLVFFLIFDSIRRIIHNIIRKLALAIWPDGKE